MPTKLRRCCANDRLNFAGECRKSVAALHIDDRNDKPKKSAAHSALDVAHDEVAHHGRDCG